MKTKFGLPGVVRCELAVLGVLALALGCGDELPGSQNVDGIGAGTGGAVWTTGGSGGTAGSGGMMAGSGGLDASTGGVGGMTAGSGGIGGTGGVAGTGGTGGAAGTGGTEPMGTFEGGCTAGPGAKFEPMLVTGTGPGGTYTIARPTVLGDGGFLHPPVAWGNGLGTTPTAYGGILKDLAANGFVVIANPGTGSDPQVVRQGLEWLIAQNASGEFAGKLAESCAGTIGYSMGGGAAVGAGAHPDVRAVVSIHGLQDAAEKASGPVLITTAEGDTFVTKTGYAQPCYDRSSVQPTILASHAGGDHLDPLNTGGEDAAPAIAWLRYWLYGDQAARAWFFGSDCTLCSWPDFQRKNHTWD